MIQVPNSGRRRALAVIDVQGAFINGYSRPALRNIKKLIEDVPYDAYVEVVLSADVGSIWDTQMGWTLPEGESVQTIKEVFELLRRRSAWHIRKQSKSIFKGDPGLAPLLHAKAIEEVHLIGFDINDCVLASAFDSFDHGFVSYVIEECCAASSGSSVGAHAIAILRHLHMTNNSQFGEVPQLQVLSSR